jgi:transposase-like protein
MPGSTHRELFRKRRFPDQTILVAVRWYLRFSLSLRDVECLMAERGVNVDHTTIWRWIQRYAPEFEKRLRSKLRCTGRCWRVDETYVRIAGEWRYLYRAVDAAGQTIDFLLSPTRDAEAARLFFRKATHEIRHLSPSEIVSDGNPTYPLVIAELQRERVLRTHCRHRCSRYLNNAVEQDHRGIKRRIVPKQWFRSWDGACNAIAGYEAMHMLRKGQVPWAERQNAVAQMALFESLLLQPTTA